LKDSSHATDLERQDFRYLNRITSVWIY